MVAPASKRLTAPVPLTTARTLLDLANDAHHDNQPTLAAVRLREAIRRYLIAACQSEGVTLPPDERCRPKLLLRLLRRKGVEVCCFADDVLEALEAMLRCEKPESGVRACLEIAYDLFGSEFCRGELQ